MSSVNANSDMLVTVKSREVQRATLAEMQGDTDRARRHLLAAAHLEQVLADDFEQAGDHDLAFRSMISAASCLWRAGQQEQAHEIFELLKRNSPARSDEVEQVEAELV